jgi:hypothetical protein
MADVDPTKLQRAAELGLVSPEIAHSFKQRMGDPGLLMGKAPVNASVMPEKAAEPQVAPVSLRAQEEVVPVGALAGDTLPQADTRQMASMGGAPDLGLSGAFAKQKRGVDVVAKAGEQQLLEQTKAIETAQREAKRLADAQLVEQADQEKRQAEELQKLKDLQTQYSTAKVDPKRLWSNMSTGDKILAGISMAFGALGAGSNGGVNTAVKVIESAIDRDLKLQEDEIGRKRDAVTVQSGIIAEMRQQFKDKDLANTAARMAIMEQMKLQVDGLAAKFGSQKVKGEAMQLNGALDQKLAEAQATFQKQYASVAAAQRLAGGKASAAEIAMLPEDQRDRAVVLPGGQTALTYTKDDAKRVKEAVGSYQSAVGTINEIMKLQKDAGSAFLPKSEAKEKYATLVNELMFAYKTMKQTGALDKGTQEVFDRLIGDPGSLFQGAASAKLQTLRQGLERDLKAELAQRVPGYKAVNYKEAK